jgi:predicted transcriptional regulator
MEKTTLYLPSELHRALYEFARRTGRPQAAVVREALDVFLRQQDRPVLRSIGIGENASLNAVDTEEWLEANWRPR